MTDIRPLIADYKANIPLHMLETKYSIPIHTIIEILYAYSTQNLERIK